MDGLNTIISFIIWLGRKECIPRRRLSRVSEYTSFGTSLQVLGIGGPMPLNAREYRDEAYRLRQHPAKTMPDPAFGRKESWLVLYFSLIPFVILEYVLEVRLENMISGLVFPTAFLLFWAFYYSHYRPGSLEHALNRAQGAELEKIPFLLLGTAIWFVKITFVRTFEWIARTLLGTGVKPKRPVTRPIVSNRPTSNTQSSYSTRKATSQPKRPEVKKPPQEPQLPSEVVEALAVLGLNPCRDWNLIHHRYRELAKRSHPDLNADITSAGQRFMIYDSAYRRLLAVKARYFIEK
jgi:hypothetical protein